ncbi:hypothetical protein [Pedobacter sp. Leaf216]|uniref:hypothetical protein n=1 Tax=Pedobacter sp. Leaf216 TaxID=1735684 RepID=UPI000A78B597|nr:hypothetical protein [Pedobacter sp. Leaf216]
MKRNIKKISIVAMGSIAITPFNKIMKPLAWQKAFKSQYSFKVCSIPYCSGS